MDLISGIILMYAQTDCAHVSTINEASMIKKYILIIRLTLCSEACILLTGALVMHVTRN